MPYEWLDNWIRIPQTPSARDNGRTHAVVEAADGSIFVYHQAQDGLLRYDPDGGLMWARGGDRWVGAHGMTIVREGNEEFLWLADQASTEVCKVTLEGETVLKVERPDHERYRGEAARPYIPTWAAQNPLNGDVWVGDGYGSWLVHRYDREGNYLSTLTGSDEMGELHESHGVNFRAVNGGVELWITDRANRRVQIFDGEGRFLRGTDVTHSPCCFSFLGDEVLIPELFTGVKILNADTLELIEEVGDSPHVSRDEGVPQGWPNLAGTQWVKPGAFNSPHGGTFLANGDIVITEWIVGGRITRLKLL